MLSNQEQKERKSRIAALAGTILFHGMLLFTLFLLALRTPLPLPDEEGVEVNLGYDSEAIDDIQPEVPALAPNTVPQPIQNKPDDQQITQNTKEAQAIDKNKNKTAKPIPEIKTTPVVEKRKEPAVNQKALNPDKSSRTYEGIDGKGNGISFDLGGRGSRSLPKPIYNSPESGKIVVSIKVNREGKVTYASAGAKGTTISEINLRQQAESAARRTLFASDPEAPEEQRGTITYVFVKQK